MEIAFTITKGGSDGFTLSRKKKSDPVIFFVY